MVNKVAGSVSSRNARYYCGTGQRIEAHRITYGDLGRTVHKKNKEVALKKICVKYGSKRNVDTACSGCGIPSCACVAPCLKKVNAAQDIQAVYLIPAGSNQQ